MPPIKNNKEIFEQIYKISLDGQTEVYSDLKDIHKLLLGIADDMSFKPMGFKSIDKEAMVAIGSLSKLQSQIQSTAKSLARGIKSNVGAEIGDKIGAGVSRSVKSVMSASTREMVEGQVKKYESAIKEIESLMSGLDDESRFEIGFDISQMQKELNKLKKPDLIDDSEAFKSLRNIKNTMAGLTKGETLRKVDIGESIVEYSQKGATIIEESFDVLRNPVRLQRTLEVFSKKMFEWSKKGKDVAGKFKSGSGDFAKLMAGGRGKGQLGELGGAVGKAGGAGKAAGAAGAAGGGELAGLAEVAKVAGTVAGVAAAIIAIIKVLMDAEAATADFNKELFSAVNATDLVSDAFGKGGVTAGLFNNRLSALYDSANDLGFALKTGVKSEDFVKTIGAMNAVGLKYTDIIKSDATATEDLQKMVSMANIASRNFGTGLEDSAKIIGSWSRDLLMSNQNIRESFAAIQTDAGEAHMETKKFFDLVADVSSEFVLFGVRTQEVSGLLNLLGKVAGPKKAAEMIGDLTKNIKNLSESERLRMVVMAGTGRVGEMLARSNRRELDALRKNTIEKNGNLASSEDLDKALAGDNDAYNRLKKSMSDQDWLDLGRGIGKFQTQAKLLGEGGAMALQEALAGADLSAQLEVQFNMVERLMGRPLDQLSAIQRKVARDQLGMSIEQFHVLEQLDKTMKNKMSEQVKAIEASGDPTRIFTSMAEFQKSGNRTIGQLVTIDKKLFRVTGKGAAEEVARTELLDQNEKKMLQSSNEQGTIADQQRKATVSMSDHLGNIVKILERKLGAIVQLLIRLVPGSEDIASKLNDTTAEIRKSYADDPEMLKNLDSVNKGMQESIANAEGGSRADIGKAVVSDLMSHGAFDTLDPATFEKIMDKVFGVGGMGPVLKKGEDPKKRLQEFIAALPMGEFSKVGEHIGDLSEILAANKTSLVKEKKEHDAYSDMLAHANDLPDIAKQNMLVSPALPAEPKSQVPVVDLPTEFDHPLSVDIPATAKAAEQQVVEIKKVQQSLSQMPEMFAAGSMLAEQGLGAGESLNIREMLEKKKQSVTGQPAQDMLISKTGYVKLSAGDVAFNPGEAARGVRAPAGALAGRAMAALGGGGGGAAMGARTMNNTFNIIGGDPEKVKQVIIQVLNEDRRREVAGIK